MDLAKDRVGLLVGWLVGWLIGCLLACLLACLTSQQHASVSQGRISTNNFTCCHTETEVADQTFYLTQSQYTDTGPTSTSADPIAPGAWQGSYRSAKFLSHWYDSTPKKSRRKRDSNPGSSALEANALTTRPTRRWLRTETAQCNTTLCTPSCWLTRRDAPINNQTHTHTQLCSKWQRRKASAIRPDLCHDRCGKK